MYLNLIILNELKKIVPFLFVALFFSSYAQFQKSDSIAIVGQKPLVINGDLTLLPVFASRSDLLSLLSSEVPNPYETDWNNNSLRIRWKENARFPIVLHFSESQYAPPVQKKMVITSRYGWRHGRPHKGIDIDLHTGDPVFSVLSGKVRYAKYQRGFGNVVVIRHDNGLETIYAHLSKFLVAENDMVEKGQIIGHGGATGNARGSHLHFETHYKGKAIHPEYIFDFEEATKIRAQEVVITPEWSRPRLYTSTKKCKITLAEKPDPSQDYPDESAKVYVVKKGDTLHRIADENNMNVSEICEKNAIDYDAVLNIGQEIVLF